MTISKKIISSLFLQDELNPDVWDLKDNSLDPENAENYDVKPEIKKRLLKVAEIFIDYIDTDLYIHDIIFVGSLVGYNWSEFSDFDIHIVVDLNETGDEKELYEELFRIKK